MSTVWQCFGVACIMGRKQVCMRMHRGIYFWMKVVTISSKNLAFDYGRRPYERSQVHLPSTDTGFIRFANLCKIASLVAMRTTVIDRLLRTGNVTQFFHPFATLILSIFFWFSMLTVMSFKPSSSSVQNARISHFSFIQSKLCLVWHVNLLLCRLQVIAKCWIICFHILFRFSANFSKAIEIWPVVLFAWG